MAGGRPTTAMVTCTTGTFALVGSRGPFLPVRPLLVREGRGRRGGSEGLLVPLQIPCVAALVVDSGSGMLAVLVFPVMFLFALCSLRSSSGLRCSASWPAWTRSIFRVFGALIVDSGSGMRKVGLSGVVPRAVLPSSVLAVVCAGWFCWLR